MIFQWSTVDLHTYGTGQSRDLVISSWDDSILGIATDAWCDMQEINAVRIQHIASGILSFSVQYCGGPTVSVINISG